jgi:crotonobetainyl-CoA:carnitine CoA-transferase CaiB-like acyl-CoA transferase
LKSSLLFAQGGGPAAGGGMDSLFSSMAIPLAITMVLMYLLLMRPEQKKRKEMERVLDKEKHEQQLELLKQQNRLKEEQLNYLKEMERKLKHMVIEWRKTENKEEVVRLIHDFNGDAVPFMDYPALFAHPQVEALNIVQDIEHPTAGAFKTIGPVWRFSETKAEIHSPPPTLGQHTEEVLGRLGLTNEQIQHLRTQGVIR